MATQPLKEGELDPQTRARARKALHEANSKKRAIEIEQQKADFAAAKDDPLIITMIQKARDLSALHLQMAKDGVGIRATGGHNEHGEAESETVFFTNDKRITELDKSAGLDEWINWAERMLGTQAAPVRVQPPAAAETEEVLENGPADTGADAAEETAEEPAK